MFYGVEFLPDSLGKTEVSDCDHCADLVVEDVGEKVLFLEFLDESVIFVMGVGTIPDGRTVLEDLVVGIVGPGHLELVVIEEAGGSVDLGEGRLVLLPDHTDDGSGLSGHTLEGGGNGGKVFIVLGGS